MRGEYLGDNRQAKPSAAATLVETRAAIDKSQQTSIPLPRSDKKYKIISRQSPTYLGANVTKDGKVEGSVEISQPEEFWGASKYLILVQD